MLRIHENHHHMKTQAQISSKCFVKEPGGRADHLSLSLAPAEKLELLSTSPISSRQKLKLLIVHMYENLTTFTYDAGHKDIISSLNNF